MAEKEIKIRQYSQDAVNMNKMNFVDNNLNLQQSVDNEFIESIGKKYSITKEDISPFSKPDMDDLKDSYANK
jgi:hypothetical protein